MCMSMTTPSLHVCPWAAWAVVANPGANGNCFRVTRSTGRFRPLSRYHGFFCGATGKTLSSSIPSTRHLVLVLNRTKMHAGNSFQICVASWLAHPTASACQTQPTISPAHPCKIPRLRSKWSAAATGIPMHSGKTPYKDPQSWSWRCSHVNFSLARSGFSRKAVLDILPFAMAWCSTCLVSAAQAFARSLFTWYFTAFVAKIAFAPANFAEAAMEPSAALALDWRSFLHMSHSKRRIASGAALPEFRMVYTRLTWNMTTGTGKEYRSRGRPWKGVGGTRALAHSIFVCVCACVCNNVQIYRKKR